MASSFCSDSSRLVEYTRRAGLGLWPEEACEVDVLDWPPGPLPSSINTAPSMTHCTVPELLRAQEPRLRVVCAPLDEPSRKNAAGLQRLFEHYSIPSDFVSQRLQSVTHSFSALSEKNIHTSWFHFLCKYVTIVSPPENGSYTPPPYIADLRGTNLSHGDWTWIRSGFYLRWNGCDNSKRAVVTLIVFSASPELRARFERLQCSPDWEVTLVDPFSLYVIVLDELWLQAEGIVNGVRKVFGFMERSELDRSSKIPTGKRNEHDFVGLHNMAKHIIFLKEASEAALLMAQRLYQHHGELLNNPPQGDSSKSTMQLVHQMLSQKVTQFEVWKLQMESMDQRMENVINLAFNIVTLEDSNVMMRDSKTMKAIAAVTGFFLPATTIATIFGCAFFSADSENKAIVVTSDFWIFWCLTAPATAAVLLLYWWWSRRSDWNFEKYQYLFHLKRGSSKSFS